MSDHYQCLDQLILVAIKDHRNPLYDRHVNEEARLIAEAMGGREAFRVIDGRLTALKKSGRIVFRTKLQAASAGLRGGWNEAA